MAGPLVVLKTSGEDLVRLERLVAEAATVNPEGRHAVSEQEQDKFRLNSDEEKRAEVEGHRLNSDMTADPDASDESSDDFEAHRRVSD